jgi:hypothetical protein
MNQTWYTNDCDKDLSPTRMAYEPKCDPELWDYLERWKDGDEDW